MSTAFDPEVIAPERVRPLRRAEYDQLVAGGAFEDERLELLAGRLVTMSPLGSRCAEVVNRLTEAFVGLQGRARVRVQLPFAATEDSEPEPDVALVPPGNYGREHPACAYLVIEVADSSARRDLELKLPIYQAGAVDEYWVVDLASRQVIVHRRDDDGRLRRTREARAGEALSCAAFPDLRLDVARLVDLA